MGDNKLFDYFVENHLTAHVARRPRRAVPVPAGLLDHHRAAAENGVRRAVPLGADAARPEVRRRRGKPERRQAPDVRPGVPLLAAPAATSCSPRASARSEGTRTNIDTVYQIDADPALSAEEIALNANILRIDLDPQARREQGLAGVPAIAGTFRMPVLSMHTLGDLFVPFSMEQIYARRAAENGAGDRLVTRAIRDINHCGFNTVEMERGFADLVNWVAMASSRPATTS